MRVHAYILAKDEEQNIGRSVGALRAAGLPVTVLDSGSSDATCEVACWEGAIVESFRYTTHLAAHETICAERTGPDEVAVILDADMVVTRELLDEALSLIENGCEVVLAPILMHWNGRPLRHASLCPPKAFMFRGGARYLEAVGHGERLVAGVSARETRIALAHDDRKPLSAYLMSQARYAKSLRERQLRGELTLRDRIRTRSPAMLVATPVVSFLLRGGFLDGRAGVGYALDRLIAEAIMYRESLAEPAPKR